MSNPTRDEIEDFIEDNKIDDRAADDLRDCPGDVQRKVLARGELSSARNPSAALLARIRDARAGMERRQGPAPSRDDPDIEEFIKHNEVDESAGDTLRSSSPGVQRTVLARGELKSARNPSSALLARIRDAKLGIPAPGSGSGTSGGQIVPAASSYNAYAAPPPGYGYPYGMPPPGYPGSWCYGMPPGYPAPPGYMPPGYPGYPPPGYPGYPSGYPGYSKPAIGDRPGDAQGRRSRSRSRSSSSSSSSTRSKARRGRRR